MKFSVPELEADVKLDIGIKMYSRAVFLIYFFIHPVLRKILLNMLHLNFTWIKIC